MFFVTLFLWAVAFALSILLAPKPKIENARPAGLGDFKVPTAQEGRVVPIIWGTVRIDGPNVIWYGDLSQDSIKKKVKTGMFSSKKQTIGFKYLLGIQFALCRGVVDSLRKIWIGDRLVFDDPMGAGTGTIDQPDAFGGQENGNGGVQGDFHFYTGTNSQSINSYLAATSSIYRQSVTAAATAQIGLDYAVGDILTIIGGEYETQAQVEIITLDFDFTDQFDSYDPFEDIVSQQGWVAFTRAPNGGGTSLIVATNHIGNADTDTHSGARNYTRYFGNDPAEDYTSSIDVIYSDLGNTYTTVQLQWFLEQENLAAANAQVEIYVNFLTEALTYKVNGGALSAPISVAGIADGGPHTITFLHVSRSATIKVDGGNVATGIALGAAVTARRGIGFITAVVPTVGMPDVDVLQMSSLVVVSEAVAEYQVIEEGIYTTLPTNPVAAGGGSGTGKTLTLTWHTTSILPAYRGTTQLVWEHGYIGNSPNLEVWAFELRRCPNGLALTSNRHIVNSGDANPMNVIYEILTDTEWGLGFNASDINTSAFTTAANTLYTEGNGWSMILDGPIEAAELLNEIERQINGVIYIDRTTGKYTVKLARGDYVLGDLIELNESNIKEIGDFTRGAWEDTTNVVRVQYTDRDKEYKETYGLAQDSANIRLQANVRVAATVKFPGIKDGDLAVNIAWRELRGLSYPLARAKFTVNRTLAHLNPADVFKWSDASLGITDLAMRITRIDLGKLEQGDVVIDAVQDVFTYEVSSFSKTPDTRWKDLPDDIGDLDILDENRKIFEAPKAMCDRAEENPHVYDRVWVGARSSNSKTSSFQIWSSDDGADYIRAGSSEGFLLLGQLNGLLAMGSLPGAATISITCTPDTQAALIAALSDATALEVGEQLQNMILIEDEFIAFTTVSSAGANVVLGGCYRGMMDSVQARHASGQSVWFLAAGGNLTDLNYEPEHAVGIKLLSVAGFETLAIADASESVALMDYRAERPYPPADLQANGDTWPTSEDMDQLKTDGVYLDDKGLELAWTRRDFRTLDEVKAVLNEVSLRGDFPDANLTEYRITAYSDPSGDHTQFYQSDWQSEGELFLSRTKIVKLALPDGGGNLLTEGFEYDDGDLQSVSSGFWQEFQSSGGGSPVSEGISVVSNVAVWTHQTSSSPNNFRGAEHGYSVKPLIGVKHEWQCYVTFVGTRNASLAPIFYIRIDYGGSHNPNYQAYATFVPQFGAFDNEFPAVVAVSNVGNNVTNSASIGLAITYGVEYLFKVRLEANGTLRAYLNGVLQVSVANAVFGSPTTVNSIMFEGRCTNTCVVHMRDFTMFDDVTTPTSADLPTNLAINVETRHIYNGFLTLTSQQNLEWPFAVTTTDLTAKDYFGVREYNRETSPISAAGSTGTYTVTIGTPNAVTVQYRLNGGAWTSVVVGGTSGTFAATAGDVIELKSVTNSDNGQETLVELLDPTSAIVAFGVFTY